MAMLADVGYHLGDDLNVALDNLWFTLLFKRRAMLTGEAGDDEFRRCHEIFAAAMTGESAATMAGKPWLGSYLERLTMDGRPQHPKEWLRERASSLMGTLRSGAVREGPWAWKEPNTHVVFARLARLDPHLRFVLVMRNGLDMAWSTNQNQLAFWGDILLPGLDTGGVATHRASLAYWCAAHRRIFAEAGEFPGRLHTVDFDRLCTSPHGEIASLLDFLGIPGDPPTVERLAGMVKMPDSVGRHRTRPLSDFDPSDVEYVRSLGFT
jgi:hypothetical protein